MTGPRSAGGFQGRGGGKGGPHAIPRPRSRARPHERGAAALPRQARQGERRAGTRGRLLPALSGPRLSPAATTQQLGGAGARPYRAWRTLASSGPTGASPAPEAPPLLANAPPP